MNQQNYYTPLHSASSEYNFNGGNTRYFLSQLKFNMLNNLGIQYEATLFCILLLFVVFFITGICVLSYLNNSLLFS